MGNAWEANGCYVDVNAEMPLEAETPVGMPRDA